MRGSKVPAVWAMSFSIFVDFQDCVEGCFGFRTPGTYMSGPCCCTSTVYSPAETLRPGPFSCLRFPCNTCNIFAGFLDVGLSDACSRSHDWWANRRVNTCCTWYMVHVGAACSRSPLRVLPDSVPRESIKISTACTISSRFCFVCGSPWQHSRWRTPLSRLAPLLQVFLTYSASSESA